jgi:hypothetical protein
MADCKLLLYSIHCQRRFAASPDKGVFAGPLPFNGFGVLGCGVLGNDEGREAFSRCSVLIGNLVLEQSLNEFDHQNH